MVPVRFVRFALPLLLALVASAKNKSELFKILRKEPVFFFPVPAKPDLVNTEGDRTALFNSPGEALGMSLGQEAADLFVQKFPIFRACSCTCWMAP